jgi:hypothetical protein
LGEYEAIPVVSRRVTVGTFAISGAMRGVSGDVPEGNLWPCWDARVTTGTKPAAPEMSNGVTSDEWVDVFIFSGDGQEAVAVKWASGFG